MWSTNIYFCWVWQGQRKIVLVHASPTSPFTTFPIPSIVYPLYPQNDRPVTFCIERWPLFFIFKAACPIGQLSDNSLLPELLPGLPRQSGKAYCRSWICHTKQCNNVWESSVSLENTFLTQERDRQRAKSSCTKRWWTKDKTAEGAWTMTAKIARWGRTGESQI